MDRRYRILCLSKSFMSQPRTMTRNDTGGSMLEWVGWHDGKPRSLGRLDHPSHEHDMAARSAMRQTLSTLEPRWMAGGLGVPRLQRLTAGRLGSNKVGLSLTKSQDAVVDGIGIGDPAASAPHLITCHRQGAHARVLFRRLS